MHANSYRLLLATCIVLPLTVVASNLAQAEEKRNIQYAEVDGIPLRLDLYLPDNASTPPPLVVWVHGGGWRNGSKDRCPFSWLTQHGFAVASLQYRLTDKAHFPAQIHDCKGAIRWLRGNASKYGYSAERIGAIGISAGGHLVSLLGSSGDCPELEGEVGGNLDQSSRVQAVVDMCGPADFLLLLKHRPNRATPPNSSAALLMGGPVSEKRDVAKLASPVTHITADDRPLMIFHGTKDPTVNPRQSEHFRQLYQASKLDVSLNYIPEGGHVPKEFFDRKRRSMIASFFEEHLRKPK